METQQPGHSNLPESNVKRHPFNISEGLAADIFSLPLLFGMTKLSTSSYFKFFRHSLIKSVFWFGIYLLQCSF